MQEGSQAGFKFCVRYHLSACMLSCFNCFQLLVTSWTVARSTWPPPTTPHRCQVPPSTGFSGQEYWRGLPYPPPGDLSDPGMEPASLMSPALAGGFFTTTCSAASVELTHPGSASLEKGMASPFSILALRTPWTVWKGQRIGHWKMNLVSAQYANGNQWINNSRKNEEAEPKQKQHPNCGYDWRWKQGPML